MSFLENLIPIIAIIFTFGIPGLIIFWAIYTKHRERMRLIEKGVTPEDARKYFGKAVLRNRNLNSSLKWGIILLFLGLGIFISNILSEVYFFSDGISAGLIILFIGLGFLLYYIIASKQMKANISTNNTSENN
jgi:hypothetical protein